jgi:hypothetical protein
MERHDATAGLESMVHPENAVQAYEAINNDHSIHEQIARIAYELYLQRVASGAPGSAEEDWHLAEQQFAAARPRTVGMDS